MQELQGLVKEEGIEGADLHKDLLQGHEEEEEEASNPLKGLDNLKDFVIFAMQLENQTMLSSPIACPGAGTYPPTAGPPLPPA